MDFKNWIVSEQNNNLQAITQFINAYSQKVLGGMETGNGYVRVKFPDPDAMVAQPQMRIAASVSYEGPIISDAADKGLATQKNMLKLVQDPAQKWGNTQQFNWMKNPARQADFQSAINDIQVIPRPMGLLFEIGVYMYLVNNEKLSPTDNMNEIKSMMKQYQGEIVGKITNHYKSSQPMIDHTDLVKNTSAAIFSMIAAHARDVGMQIAAKSRKMLGCSEGGCCPDKVQFMGGAGGGDMETRKDPSDIVILCSKAKESKGWNLKFGTSTRVQLADLAVQRAVFEMGRFAGLRDYKSRAATVANAQNDFDNDPFKGEGETADQRIMDYVAEVAKAYEGKPLAFTRLLNYLIHNGGNNTFLAIRNYMTNPNEVGYSQNFQTYFDIQGAEVRPKKDAFVQVREMTGAIVLTYGLESLKDKEGVQIFLMPNFTNSKRTIEFKVTNLASDVIRKRSSDPNAFNKPKRSNLPF
jgi:hypothetical protein